MDWNDLTLELDLWAARGDVARLWWRDDDAVELLPALTALLELTNENDVELALAVVPAQATDALANELARRSNVVVVQHGYAHRNHAAMGLRAIECGGDRPVIEALEELRRGHERLRHLFGRRFSAILAPPWNNIDDAVAMRLDECGFAGLSTFGPRARQPRAAQISVANVHVDPLNWRKGGSFAGRDKALSGIVGELKARRLGMTESEEPLGLLTHHLRHDAGTWDFLARFLEITTMHAAARWLRVKEAFAPSLVAAEARA
jgi:hypothetical protein